MMIGYDPPKPSGFGDLFRLLAAVVLGVVASAFVILNLFFWMINHRNYKSMYRVGESGELEPGGGGRRPGAALAFSRSRFRDVEKGMTKAEVVELLGEPLRKEPDYRDKELDRWSYTSYVVTAHDHFKHDILFKDDRVEGKDVEESVEF